jgi:hypothetical protein
MNSTEQMNEEAAKQFPEVSPVPVAKSGVIYNVSITESEYRCYKAALAVELKPERDAVTAWVDSGAESDPVLAYATRRLQDDAVKAGEWAAARQVKAVDKALEMLVAQGLAPSIEAARKALAAMQATLAQ